MSHQHPPQLSRVGSWPQADSFPLGQLGEVLSALLAAQALHKGRLQLDEVVNDRLEALRLIPGAPGEEIRLRHLLTRSSGLAWREAGLYQSPGSKVPPLKTLLVQELRPAVLPPGRAITANSAAELVLAQLITENSSLSYPQLLKQELLDPVGMQETRLAQASDYGGGSAGGLAFPLLQPSVPDLHGWKTTPGDMSRLLQALVSQQNPALGPEIVAPVLRRQLNLPDGAPSASLGLLETEVSGETLFYLDSQLFGYTQRLALWPAHRRAFYVVYNSQGPAATALSEKLTQDWVQAFKPGAAPASTQDSSPANLVRADRDPHSLLKVLNLLQPQTPASASQLIAPASPEGSTAQIPLWRETGGPHASYRKATFWENPMLQGGLALLWSLIALSVLGRSLRFLYDYTPELAAETEMTVSTPEETAPQVSAAEARFQIEAPAPESETPGEASWGLPLLASLSSGFMLLFTLGFAPVLLWSGRIGEQLSLVVRNQPNGWLLAWLVMPLATLVSALMLLALLSAEWRERTRSEVWHYGVFGLSVLLWAAWANSWNLLGFRF
ncbi:MAG: serine hydrolase domain-containing protein [Candidatus Sericytochromatia bacterium]